jgi:hypothetical protein
MAVRSLVETDIPQVADLYWTYMRRRKGPAPPAVHSFLQELYFANPWIDGKIDGETASLVYEGKGGKIVGFLGVVPRKLSLGGQPIRVAFGGNFVVHPEGRSSLAGTRILGTYMRGNYAAWQTDSANDISRKLLESIGFQTIPALNIHWVRPLRPGHYCAYAISRAMGATLSASFRFAAKPFCAIADTMAEKLSIDPFRQTKSKLHAEELDVETLLQCLERFRKDYSLWPEYDAHSLSWLLRFLERNPVRGTLRKIVLRNDSQQIIGWYIYYVKPGSVGEVVQIGGDQKSTREILGHLFYDAWEHHVIGLHGVVDMRRVPHFSDVDCLFTCRGGWTVTRSRQPEMLSILERGDAFLSRLDGEWCLDPGD